MKVYVYQSCYPLDDFLSNTTQIIQTINIPFIGTSGEIFKDSEGNCWNYIGEFDETYVPPFDTFPINFSGNYFTDSVNIKYPDCNTCQVTAVSGCSEIYYLAKKCSNEEEIYVKVCDVGPISKNLQLVPKISQVVGVKNPYGDDFCVTLISKVTYSTTNYEINTPAWLTYDCNTCPIYQTYIIDSCDNTITGKTAYYMSASTTFESGISVRIDSDDLCYTIVSYEGLVVDYNLENTDASFILVPYETCEDCLISLYGG